jgi:hypothetical protein
MQLHWRSVASTSRRELEDYVRSFRIDVRCWDEDGTREYLVGRVAADEILWGDAIDDGESLLDICDCDSQGLHELHVILTQGTNEFREDLQIEEPVHYVLFVYEAVFHPDITPYRVSVLDAVFGLFGIYSLAVMWREVGDVPVVEQVQLGLCKVAGTDLVFRHNALVSPYSQQQPRGMEIDFPATAEMERWVRREWRRRYEPPGPDATS